MPRASAGGIIINGEGRVVLVEQHGNTWSFPKGGVEEGESELEAAKREIGEECGIKELTFVKDLGSYERYSIDKDGITENTSLGMRKRAFFLFGTDETILMSHDSEVTKAEFVTIDQALAMLTHPKDREFLVSVRGVIEEAIKEVR